MIANGLHVALAHLLMPTKRDRQNIQIFIEVAQHLFQARLGGSTFGISLKGTDEWFLKECRDFQIGSHGAVQYLAIPDREVECWLHATNQQPFPAVHTCRCLAACLLHASGCEHSVEPVRFIGPGAGGDELTVEMRFDLSQLPGVVRQGWGERINCVRATDRLGMHIADEHALRAWLCTRCVVTFQLAAIACGLDALALTHVVARTALIHRTRVFPFNADYLHDDAGFSHARLCAPIRDAIYALEPDAKRRIHAAAGLLRGGLISAHAHRIRTQQFTWLQASDLAAADLYVEGASKRAIGAILARSRGASAREVNLGRLLDTRDAGAHTLPVALAEIIQTTVCYDLLASAPGIDLEDTGFAEICASAARVLPADDGLDVDTHVCGVGAFQRDYYGDEPIQPNALRFLIASAAAFGTLLIYLSDARPGEYGIVLDGLPFTADVQSDDAVFRGSCTPELAAAQQSASHRIFGSDTERRFQPAGKALAAWYDAVSKRTQPPSGGLFEALRAAIGVGYAGCPEDVRARNALVIMYLAGRIFRKHEYIGQYLRAAHAAQEDESSRRRAASDAVAAEHNECLSYFQDSDVPYGGLDVPMSHLHFCTQSSMRVEQDEAVARAREQVQGGRSYSAWTSATSYAAMHRRGFR